MVCVVGPPRNDNNKRTIMSGNYECVRVCVLLYSIFLLVRLSFFGSTIRAQPNSAAFFFFGLWFFLLWLLFGAQLLAPREIAVSFVHLF